MESPTEEMTDAGDAMSFLIAEMIERTEKWKSGLRKWKKRLRKWRNGLTQYHKPLTKWQKREWKWGNWKKK